MLPLEGWGCVCVCLKSGTSFLCSFPDVFCWLPDRADAPRNPETLRPGCEWAAGEFLPWGTRGGLDILREGDCAWGQGGIVTGKPELSPNSPSVPYLSPQWCVRVIVSCFKLTIWYQNVRLIFVLPLQLCYTDILFTEQEVSGLVMILFSCLMLYSQLL